MSLRLLVLVALALFLSLPAASGAPGGVDATITMRPGEAPAYAGPPGIVTFENQTPGEWAQWRVQTQQAYTTLEVRVLGAYDITRPRQVVPLLFPDASEAMCHDPAAKDYCAFPLFETFPHERIWAVDSPARVFFTNGTASDVILRLGIPGPFNGTLALQRDVTPPTFALANVTNVTSIGFVQRATTGELALADLQVRRATDATSEWVRNPTTVYHYLQIFPVQGLAADTDHEVRVVFTDWAGNEATSPTYHVRTAAAPIVPTPVVEPRAPLPNVTISNGSGIVVRASYSSPESPVAPSGVRLFFDKEAVNGGVLVNATEIAYSVPATLAPGKHSVAVEITNAAGGTGTARWSFTVAGPNAAAPGWVGLALLALGAAAMVTSNRRRR